MRDFWFSFMNVRMYIKYSFFWVFFCSNLINFNPNKNVNGAKTFETHILIRKYGPEVVGFHFVINIL